MGNSSVCAQHENQGEYTKSTHCEKLRNNVIIKE